MPATEPRRDRSEIVRLGREMYDRVVLPTLRPDDDGKYVAVDVDTGDYELDEDDYSAIMRLRARRPVGDQWLGMVGQPTAHRMLGLR